MNVDKVDRESSSVGVGVGSWMVASGGEAACALVVGDPGDEAAGAAADWLHHTVSLVTGVRLPRFDSLEACPLRRALVLCRDTDGAAGALRLLEEDGVAAGRRARGKRPGKALGLDSLGEQGFIAHRTRRGERELLVLASQGASGLLYGAVTLGNRVWREGAEWLTGPLDSPVLPRVNVPSFLVRSIATNLGGPDWLGFNQWEKEWVRDGVPDPQGFVDWAAGHKINNLTIWAFGLAFGLAYASRRFPEMVNPYHPNVRSEFMPELIRHAHRRHMKVYLFFDFPDNCTAVVRARPSLAGKNIDMARFPGDATWRDYQRSGDVDRESIRRGFSWVCASEPATMEFWKEYVDELLEVYPDVDGVGGQFCEHPDTRCNCPSCTARFFELQWDYFVAMGETARRRNPAIDLWFYDSWGALEIRKRRELIPNVTYVDWGVGYQPFTLRRYRPRGEWYLYHRMRERWPEFGTREVARLFNQAGVSGFQVRSVYYKDVEQQYASFEEFSWNPDLTIDDYADSFVRRVTRSRDTALAEAYALWIRCKGLAEMVDYQGQDQGQGNREEGVRSRGEPWEPWASRLAELVPVLESRLEGLSGEGFAAELAAAVRTELPGLKARAPVAARR